MSETLPVNDPDPPLLVKAVFGVLDEALEDIRKVAFFSSKVFASDDEEKSCHSKTFEEAENLFSCLDENSASNDYGDVLNLLRKMPAVNLKTLDNVEMHSSVIKFCSDFKELRDLLRLKMSTPTAKSLFEMRESESCFQKKYEELRAELESLQKEVETSREEKRKIISELPSQRESERLGFAAEDFQSQHPFFIRANAEEQIEFITKVNENKLSHLRNKQEQAEKKLKDATNKHKSEMWKIIEETMQTRIFVDWIKEINRDKMKAREEEQKELWQKFSGELLKCRDLCLKCRDMDKEYNEIMNEKRGEEEKKQVAAAVILQAHFRGYLTRKKYKIENSLEITDFDNIDI